MCVCVQVHFIEVPEGQFDLQCKSSSSIYITNDKNTQYTCVCVCVCVQDLVISMFSTGPTWFQQEIQASSLERLVRDLRPRSRSLFSYIPQCVWMIGMQVCLLAPVLSFHHTPECLPFKYTGLLHRKHSAHLKMFTQFQVQTTFSVIQCCYSIKTNGWTHQDGLWS